MNQLYGRTHAANIFDAMIIRLFFFFYFSFFIFHFSYGTEQSLTPRYIDGLLQRGMYESALYFCDFELQKTEETPERIFYAAEKVRVWTRQALSLPVTEREAVLHQIEQWEQQWSQQWRLADTLQFSYQLAISDLKLGELYRLEEITVAQNASEEEKRSFFLLDRARERLEALRKNVSDQMADRTISPLKARELFTMRQQIDFQAAMVWRSLALGFERGSDEQLDCLQRALQGLTPLTALSGTDPILIQSRLEKAVCLRLLHELDAAGETLASILQEEALSESQRVQATTEGIRLLLAQGKIDQAIQWGAVEPSAPHPYYDLARLEAYLNEWKIISRSDEQKGQPLLNRVLEFSKQIEQLHGPYWSRRAQMLVAESTKNETTGNFGVYVQLAEDAYHREQFEDAIRYYDLSSIAAEQSGDASSAFRYAISAALVESQLENNLAAQKLFRDAAKKWPEQEQASGAYLFGVELLQKNEGLVVADLIDALMEFAKIWPQSPQHREIALKVAQLLEKEGRFQEAFEICPEFEGQVKTINDLQTLVAQGQRDEALPKAAQLWENNPRDPAVAQLYGNLLAASAPKNALEFWRAIEKRFDSIGRPRTEVEDALYWKAKETIIHLHFQLGNREQAQKLLDLVRLLHPEQNERFKDLSL